MGIPLAGTPGAFPPSAAAPESHGREAHPINTAATPGAIAAERHAQPEEVFAGALWGLTGIRQRRRSGSQRNPGYLSHHPG